MRKRSCGLMIPLLLLIVFLPFLLIIPLFAIPERDSFDMGLLSAGILLLLSLLAAYIGLTQGFENLTFHLNYLSSPGLGLDLELTKYSNIFLVMSSIVLFASAIVAKRFIKESQRIYNLLFLLISGSTIGLFLSGNLFLFYVFWEISEIAMFFIIYMFGGYDRRYAAIKFIIYSIIASLFLLIGIMIIYSNVTVHTFLVSSLISQAASMSASSQLLAMLLLLIAFMIKIPSFPFHHWLPDAHTEAPTTGSMILAGILLKFGGYGLLLMFLILPIATTYSHYIAVIFIISAIYSAFVAMRQTHLKRLIAYTSIIDMGIASLGIASVNAFGISGGLYAMLSHGIVISLLFLIAGTIDEAFGTLLIERLKGIVKHLSTLAYEFLFGVFALVGIPLTAGFIGDLLVFIGAYKAYGIIGVAPLAALVLIGAFIFWVVERSFFNSSKAIQPIAFPEIEISYAASFLMSSAVLLGVFPSLLLSPFAV